MGRARTGGSSERGGGWAGLGVLTPQQVVMIRGAGLGRPGVGEKEKWARPRWAVCRKKWQQGGAHMEFSPCWRDRAKGGARPQLPVGRQD